MYNKYVNCVNIRKEIIAMKKLLTILGSTTLLVIPTISVLSCKTINAISTAEEYTPESIKDQVVKYLQKAKYKDNECV